MSASITLRSAVAVALTASFAVGCTIVQDSGDAGGQPPDVGAPSPDAAVLADAASGTDDGPSSDGASSTDAGSSADANASGDVNLSADASPSGDGSPDQAAPPPDGAQAGEASVGDASANDAPVVVGNGCSDPASTNQTPAMATPYALGSAFQACLRSGTDVNYYSFTVPASPPKGGYVIVKVNNVGLQGTIDLTAQTASDSTNLVNTSNTTAGGGAALFFAAAPGATFFAVVKNRFTPPAATPETAYTLTATFTGVNDPNAPNGTVATAAMINPATPVQGYFFAGYASSASPPAAAWESWYKITLPAGAATIALTNVPSDATGDVAFFDGNTQQLSEQNNTTAGGNVQFDVTVASAGLYYLRVQPRFGPTTLGTSTTVPVYMTQPWTLTVTSH